MQHCSNSKCAHFLWSQKSMKIGVKYTYLQFFWTQFKNHEDCTPRGSVSQGLAVFKIDLKWCENHSPHSKNHFFTYGSPHRSNSKCAHFLRWHHEPLALMVNAMIWWHCSRQLGFKSREKKKHIPLNHHSITLSISPELNKPLLCRYVQPICT